MSHTTVMGANTTEVSRVYFRFGLNTLAAVITPAANTILDYKVQVEEKFACSFCLLLTI